ncbi:hypothetical protein KAZ82_01705, partial [Candidatus Babeliales bacterium]|nr:hypothetical protein [Candidatus Babeliales bacterium]
MQYQFVQGQKYYIGIAQNDVQQAQAIAHHFNISLPLAHVLLARNLRTIDDISNFLLVPMQQNVNDPVLLKDAQKSVKRIIQAIENQEKILIFGDYDVDGITSSSLMMMGLLSLGAQVNFFLPNRVKDGYGLSKKIVHKAAKNNYKVIITVDNGIT